MSALEQDARWIEADAVFMRFPRLNKTRIVITVPISGAHDAVCQVYRQSVGVHINQFCGEVGVGST